MSLRGRYYYVHSFLGRSVLVTFALLLAVLGTRANAVISADVSEGMLSRVSTDFTKLRDPQDFMRELDVMMPRPTVPLTRRDAIAHELRYRSESMSDVEVLATAKAIAAQADEAGYDPMIFLALIRIESNFNHLATSPVGAEGLMQLMPATANWMAKRKGIEWPDRHSFDPVLNVQLGSSYLSHLVKLFQGRLDLALTAYNRGPSATHHLVKKYGRVPKTIRDFYATKVLNQYKTLRKTYGYLPQGI